MKKRRSKKAGPVRAKKVVYDGIQFQSGLEKYMYMALKKADISCRYEIESFELISGFNFKNKSYERQANGKGEYTERGNRKIRPITYTPDFTGPGFIIECKGRANESFPIRWKLFKRYVAMNMPDVTLYKPQNQKECDETVQLIQIKRRAKQTMLLKDTR
jgi:hypothetical protein